MTAPSKASWPPWRGALLAGALGGTAVALAQAAHAGPVLTGLAAALAAAAGAARWGGRRPPLPAERPAAAPARAPVLPPPPPVTKAPRKGPPRILVIDDDAAIRGFVASVLAASYRVLQAGSGEQGLALARAERPDLIVSDVMMGGVDGLALLRALRSDPDMADTPVVLLTARAEVEARVQGLTQGANDYVAKPFAPSELLARIDAQLRLREAAARSAQNERLAATGLLTSGFAHEVRNPLNGLVNALPPLREVLQGRGDPRLALQLLDVAEECARRIRHLADDLLGFARPGGQVGPVDVGAALDASVRLLAGRVPPGVRWVRDFHAQVPARGDGAALAQVWVNLLDNALRAVGEAGTITLGTDDAGRWVRVWIEDSGPGVAPEHLPHLFTPFYSTRPPGEGTGLGLALCRRVVLAQGGDIALHCEPGHGARVEVRLPAWRDG